MTQNLREWIGRSEENRDIAEPGPIRRLAALLDHEAPPWAPGALPPLGHWLYFLPEARQSSLGPDGHPARGGFLPPVALPRRMWAGGRIDFLAPVPFGAEMTRRSTIANIADKSGASGAMTFVLVRQEIFVKNGLAIRDELDIVYRAGPQPAASAPAPSSPPLMQDCDFRRAVAPGPVDLFRYSALTFNSHRIHYDRDYATRVEGYPGLRRAWAADRDAACRSCPALETGGADQPPCLPRPIAAIRWRAVRSLRKGFARRGVPVGAGAGRIGRDGRAGFILDVMFAG